MWGGVGSFLLDLRWRYLGSRVGSVMIGVKIISNIIYYYRLSGGVNFLSRLMLDDLCGVIHV